MDKARRVLGPENVAMMSLRRSQARALYLDEEASLADVRRAIEILEDVSAISNRFLGPNYPRSREIKGDLDAAREKLARVA